MKRTSPVLISLVSAVVTSTMLLCASAATAAPAGNYYAAKPATASSSARLVVRDTLWKCSDAGCASVAKSSSRPAIVCESLVKTVGAVTSFRAGDQEFDADALAKCNTRA